MGTKPYYIFSLLLEEKEMRTLEPRPHTLQGCFVLLKYFEETLSHVYSGFHANIVGYQGDGWVDPLLAVYQPCLLNHHW